MVSPDPRREAARAVLVAWLNERAVECEHSATARRSTERMWRTVTDEDAEAGRRLADRTSSTRHPRLDQAERVALAETEARIAAHHEHEAAWFRECAAALDAYEQAMAGEAEPMRRAPVRSMAAHVHPSTVPLPPAVLLDAQHETVHQDLPGVRVRPLTRADVERVALETLAVARAILGRHQLDGAKQVLEDEETDIVDQVWSRLTEGRA